MYIRRDKSERWNFCEPKQEDNAGQGRFCYRNNLFHNCSTDLHDSEQHTYRILTEYSFVNSSTAWTGREQGVDQNTGGRRLELSVRTACYAREIPRFVCIEICQKGYNFIYRDWSQPLPGELTRKDQPIRFISSHHRVSLQKRNLFLS